MNANYFFIDGSALTAQIRQLQRAQPTYQRRKLCPREFINRFIEQLPDLHGGSYKRATFYFPRGDEIAVEDYLRMPDRQKPGEIRDLQFKFCGHKLKKSVDFVRFVEECVPEKFQNRFSKSEKGIDIEICCDALRLASSSRMERLFLLTNDGDFIPLFRTLKEFGANISLIHLSNTSPPNLELLRESDSYDIISPRFLTSMFFPISIENTAPQLEEQGRTTSLGTSEPQSEKPETEPSDLNTFADIEAMVVETPEESPTQLSDAEKDKGGQELV